MEEQSYNKKQNEKIKNPKISIDDINLTNCNIKSDLHNVKKVNFADNNGFNMITT